MKNGAICLIMFTPGFMVIIMSKMVHFFLFFADARNKSVTVWTKCLPANERFCLVFSENAMDCWTMESFIIFLLT